MSRWQRARLWIRWALRDARRHRAQVLSIALLLALGVGMYASMSSMSEWRVRSADASFQLLRAHDLRVSLVQGGTAGEGDLLRALRRSGANADVAAASERLVVPTQVNASAGGRTIIVPGRLVGAVPDRDVDRVAVREGTAVRAPTVDGLPAVELEHNFAQFYGLPSSGRLELSGGRRVAYTAQVFAPEYFIVTAPGADFGAESAFAVVFAPLSTAQALAGRPGRVNELVLRIRPGADPARVRALLAASLRRTVPGADATFTAGSEEPARRLIYRDAEGDQEMLDIFAALLLGAAAFAAFNLVSRVVEAQRREIGIGMALGVPPRTLARRPFLLSAQIAIAGVALGVPVGIGVGAWLSDVMNRFFTLPVVEADFQPDLYLRGALLGLALPLLAAAFPVRRALRVTPVEAIRVGARAARRSGWAWMLKDVRVPGGALANLPLRNVLRTPRRTIMTLSGVAAVVTIVIALSGVMDSFSATLAASRDEALAGHAGRLTVDLVAPARDGGAAVRQVTSAASVGASQSSLRLASTLSAHGRDLDASVESVPGARPIWHPTFDEGGLPARSPGLVIARAAANHLRVDVGDSVRVRHPVPTGRGRYELRSTTLPVVGIHRSPLRFIAYTNQRGAAALQVDGLVNRISVVPAPGRTAEDVRSELLRLPSVGAVQGAAALTDAVDERMEQFDDILLIAVMIAAAMALLIAFNAAAINNDERLREHATMFAHGVTPRQVVRGATAEALIIGLLGTALGVAAGHVLLSWLVNTNLPETMPDVGTLVSVAGGTYVLAFATGTLAVAAAPLLTLRRLDRTDVPSTLRVIE